MPLAEDIEAYEVDIVSAGRVLRTLSAGAPSAVYASAQQIADFGAVQASVSVSVYQISQSFGRGTARSATL